MLFIKNVSPTPVYYLDGQALRVIASYKDIDVAFDTKFRFNFHYVDVFNHAFRM